MTTTSTHKSTLIVEKEKKTTNVINKFLTISAIVDLMAMSNEFIFYLQAIGKKNHRNRRHYTKFE